MLDNPDVEGGKGSGGGSGHDKDGDMNDSGVGTWRGNGSPFNSS